MHQLIIFIVAPANRKEEGKEVPGRGGLSDKVSLYKGDITVLEVDAIVNAGKEFFFFNLKLVTLLLQGSS